MSDHMSDHMPARHIGSRMTEYMTTPTMSQPGLSLVGDWLLRTEEVRGKLCRVPIHGALAEPGVVGRGSRRDEG